ncbi:MAG: transcription antitermination factor NusB [Bacteroidaceae bacterium]|nr:transcription antitermination factor NusB [Bacteroidaceae bacterium]
MINRTLIRLKIVQLMYAYYQNSGKNIETAEKELLFSLSKAYDLYNYMLLLMVSVSRYAFQQVEHKEQLNKVAHIDEPVSHRFADNQFTTQLENNKQLQEFVETKKKTWDNDIDYIKKLYADIVESEYYKEYMAQESVTYADDREVWRKIYKNIIMKDERIDDILEDQSLYWNDDREIIDTFVLKTIKRFEAKNGADQELVPEYKDLEDREFATRLFRRTILNDEYYRSLIGKCIKNWEFNRLAYMDVIIMQIAVAELLSFPQIPISVTINEYVEIAKWYSTPKSAGYVNGIIDAVAKTLQKENKLTKAQ